MDEYIDSMSDTRRKRHRIDPLLSRALKGEATPEQAEAVRMWRQASRDNERKYRELTQIRGLASQLRDRVEIGAAPTAAKLLGMRYLLDPRGRFWLRLRGASHSLGSRRVVAAAMVAAFLVAGGVALFGRRAAGTAAQGFGAAEFVTSRSETATIELRDGTVVRLGPESRLRMPGGPDRREVSLSGRGYFAVARQAGQSFTVRTASGSVEVLGTRFDIEARQDNLRLVVVEGQVAVSTEEGRQKLVAGEMSRVVDRRVLPTLKVPDVNEFVDWVGDFLVFQSTPLRDAAREIERQYDVEVLIEDEWLAGQVVTGWFTDEDVDDVLHVVCLVTAARCVREGRIVRMEPMQTVADHQSMRGLPESSRRSGPTGTKDLGPVPRPN